MEVDIMGETADHLEHYSTLICGATFCGIGAALASPDDTLLIERSGTVGREFIEAINPGGQGSLRLTSSWSSQFLDELKSRNLIAEDGGPVHLPALHAVLCSKLVDARVNVLLLTEIIAVRSHARGYEITILNTSGIQKITAGSILDTTTHRVTRRAGQLTLLSKSLNAYIHAGDSELVLPELDHMRAKLIQGRFRSEHILKWELDPGEGWPEARISLIEFWSSRPETLQPWTIALTASEFEYSVTSGPEQLDEHWHYLPSAGYDHPLGSLDQGYLYRYREERIGHGHR
jgi:hypothetical protein